MKDLGEKQYILEVKVIRDHKIRKIVLSQATYVDKFLVKYVMEDSGQEGSMTLQTWNYFISGSMF